MNIIQKPAHPANYMKGRAGHMPDTIVCHIAAGTAIGTDAWFAAGPQQRKGAGPSSAHYLVTKLGEIHQYVQESDAAFHAGRTDNPTAAILRQHKGVSPNLFSIGIEHEGTADSEWPDELYEASAHLIADIAQRWAIPLDRTHVIGHREIDAVNRRNCPGKCDLNLLIELAKRP